MYSLVPKLKASAASSWSVARRSASEPRGVDVEPPFNHA